MAKKQSLIFGGILFIIFLALVSWQGWDYFRSRSDNTTKQEDMVDPFTSITIPEDTDAATRAVLEQKIQVTKTLYTEAPLAGDSWVAIGNLHRVFHNPQEAIDAYEKALEYQPENKLAHRNIADTYDVDLQDYETAATYYRLAIDRVGPMAPELYIALGFLYMKRLDRPDEAEKIYLQGLRDTGDTDKEILLPLIDLYKKTGNTAKYVEYVRHLRASYPDVKAFQTMFPDVSG